LEVIYRDARLRSSSPNARADLSVEKIAFYMTLEWALRGAAWNSSTLPARDRRRGRLDRPRRPGHFRLHRPRRFPTRSIPPRSRGLRLAVYIHHESNGGDFGLKARRRPAGSSTYILNEQSDYRSRASTANSLVTGKIPGNSSQNHQLPRGTPNNSKNITLARPCPLSSSKIK